MAGRVVGRLSRQLQSSVWLRPQNVGTVVSVSNRRWFSEENDEKPKYTRDYFKRLVENKPLVLFMKGDPTAPMCGFSRLVVKILHMHGVERYDHYDVLEDIEFKEGMKTFSNWPTFPQVYLNSELLGGADIILQMHQSGELVSELKKIGHNSPLEESQQTDSENTKS